MAVDFTKEQKTAIAAQGGRIIVSAAAGSGKTAVLVERVCRKICDTENPVDIERFLIVTFTNAAASDVKSKIISALHALLAQAPDNARIERQLMLVSGASISTIASYCAKLVRTYFYKLDISPDFRIMDQGESDMLDEELLTSLMEDWYSDSETEEKFAQAVEFFCGTKSDQRFLDIILKLERAVSAMPDPEGFLRVSLNAYSDGASGGFDGVFGEALLRECGDLLSFMGEKIEETGRISELHAQLSGFKEANEYDRVFVREAGRLLAGRDYEGLRALAASYKQPVRSVRNVENPELYRYLKSVREQIRSFVKDISQALFCGEEEIEQDRAALLGPLKVVCDFTTDFMRKRFELKQKNGAFSFSDIEQLAKKLLVKEFDIKTGRVIKSDIAQEIGRDYHEILIDEYQDINELQDIIFKALSKDESNLFMVGDIKQSIYRFRQSNPLIFASKLKESADCENAAPANLKRVLLSSNFRSARPVLDFTNFLFSLIMSERAGEVKYGEKERLNCGRGTDGEPVEINLLLKNKDGGDSKEKPELDEAGFVAHKIKRLLAGGETITDSRTGVNRAVMPRDIVILMRNIKSKGRVFADALTAAGVTAYCEKESSFFEKGEVAVVLSLLKCIDNNLDDVSLAACMMSDMWGFTPEDLANIKLSDADASFYGALCKYAEKNTRAKAFQSKLDEYRTVAANITTAELLLNIYADTAYIEKVSVSKSGASNLKALYECAADYESTGMSGLYSFVRYVENIISSGKDTIPSNSFSDTGDAVRIMSIHKSKGLEFPVVFLCNLSNRLNKKDGEGFFLSHREMGLASKIRDGKRMAVYDTMQRAAIAKRIGAETLSEELRCLYVALTRAREKLFLSIETSVTKDGLYNLKPGGVTDEGGLCPADVLSSSNFGSLILKALIHHPDCFELRKITGMVHVTPVEGPDVKLNIITDIIAEKEAGAAEEHSVFPDYGENIEEELERRIFFKYPFESAISLPAKLSVTGLSKYNTDEPAYAYKRAQDDPAQARFFVKPPEDRAKGKLSAAQKGIVLHKFMQFADILRLKTPEGVDGEIKRLIHSEQLLEKEANVIDRSAVIDFANSALAMDIVNSERVIREHRFAVLFEKEDFERAGIEDFTLPEGENIVLQGVIDCAFLKNGAFTIVDFKTDYAKLDIEAVKGRYRAQLHIYARALEQMSGTPVESAVVYSFTQRITVEIFNRSLSLV